MLRTTITVTSPYMLAAVQGIRSLRDLDGANADHMTMLEDMRDASYAALEKHHGLSKVDIKVAL